MIANYGYEDGSGIYYISIDTGKCAECRDRNCIGACPGELFVVELDDYDDEVVVVKKVKTRLLKSCCSACKPTEGRVEKLPCEKACTLAAIKHTW